MTPCWTGKLDWIIETFGDLSREWCEYVAQNGPCETCMLPEGHAGPHVWTPNDKIVLVFDESRS